MPAMISRLQTKTGEVYALSQNWPGADQKAPDDPDQLKVGPIFLLPGEEEPVYENDDEGEPTSEISATFSQPPRYEVWCVTDRVLTIMMAQLHGHQIPQSEIEYIRQGNAGMTRRTIYLDAVSAVDEDWPAAKAFVRLVDRFIDLSKADDEETQEREAQMQERQEQAQQRQQPPQQQQQQPQLGNGGGASLHQSGG